MIFRRRRTRIEIEQTIVRLDGGEPHPIAPRPIVVAPSAPSSVETPLAKVLEFPAPEAAERNATISAPAVNAPAIKENLS